MAPADGGVSAATAMAASTSWTVQYGYAFMDETTEIYGVPVPCPQAAGGGANGLPVTSSTVRGVGLSFFQDPALAGQEVSADSDGTVNDANSPTDGIALVAPVVGVATAPIGTGLWLVSADGGVFAGRGAPFEGSMGHRHLNSPVVAMSPTPDGQGYWLAGLMAACSRSATRRSSAR